MIDDFESELGSYEEQIQILEQSEEYAASEKKSADSFLGIQKKISDLVCQAPLKASIITEFSRNTKGAQVIDNFDTPSATKSAMTMQSNWVMHDLD